MPEFFPEGARKSSDYGRIVNARQFQWLKKMLDESSGKILLGGTMDEKDLFLEPTVVQVDSPTDSLVAEESFGPLIPVLPVSDLDEAIKIANEVQDTPLGIYPFGNKQETEKGVHNGFSVPNALQKSLRSFSVPSPFSALSLSLVVSPLSRDIIANSNHPRSSLAGRAPSDCRRALIARFLSSSSFD
jgi:beta-apo-4'-carotenal oxygenase